MPDANAMSMSTTCDACGLPPRSPDKPLLKCTRCKRAQYHDRKCQQDHYAQHKVECRRFAAAAAKKAGTQQSPKVPPAAAQTPARKSLVECRTVEGRGRSLFATSTLSRGCHPLPTTNDDDGLCEPIAHPVLIETMRQTGCAYCFRPIYGMHASSAAGRLHCHCSPKCRSLDANWAAEERAMRKLPSPPSPTALSCSRILRKFKESPAARDGFNKLCWDTDTISSEEKESFFSIMAQCHVFLRAMEDGESANMANELLHPDPSRAYKFMSRLSMNGFTVSNSEQLPIGHGVYLGASMINHSCRPNAVPTFWLRPSKPPMLQITVCKNAVNAGSEITISYCDASTPRCIRRESLWKNYKFVCDCTLCKDTDRDDEMVGLKCTTDACQGMVRSTAASAHADGSGSTASKPGYQCTFCGNTKFNGALKVQADSMERMKALTATEIIGNEKHHKKAREESRDIYERLKKYCRVQRSYYPAWSADLLVCQYSNALKSCANGEEQLEVCREALVVMGESRLAFKFCMDYPGNIFYIVKRGMEAKLRLFANPTDMEALGMLQDVKKEMIMYYPRCDDTIVSLDESLAAYSFS